MGYGVSCSIHGTSSTTCGRQGKPRPKISISSLGQIRRFARIYAVHVWLVAHPQKLYRRDDGSYPVPTPYDISGSAHWRNKADNCVTVWRDEQEPSSPVRFMYRRFAFGKSVRWAKLICCLIASPAATRWPFPRGSGLANDGHYSSDVGNDGESFRA